MFSASALVKMFTTSAQKRRENKIYQTRKDDSDFSMVFRILGRLFERFRDVPGDDVVQEPIRLVLQTLNFAPIPYRQEGTVKTDAITEKQYDSVFIEDTQHNNKKGTPSITTFRVCSYLCGRMSSIQSCLWLLC